MRAESTRAREAGVCLPRRPSSLEQKPILSASTTPDLVAVARDVGDKGSITKHTSLPSVSISHAGLWKLALVHSPCTESPIDLS